MIRFINLFIFNGGESGTLSMPKHTLLPQSYTLPTSHSLMLEMGHVCFFS